MSTAKKKTTTRKTATGRNGRPVVVETSNIKKGTKRTAATRTTRSAEVPERYGKKTQQVVRSSEGRERLNRKVSKEVDEAIFKKRAAKGASDRKRGKVGAVQPPRKPRTASKKK